MNNLRKTLNRPLRRIIIASHVLDAVAIQYRPHLGDYYTGVRRAWPFVNQVEHDDSVVRAVCNSKRTGVVSATTNVDECKIFKRSRWTNENATIDSSLEQIAANIAGEIIAPLGIILGTITLRILFDLPLNGRGIEEWD